MSTDLISVMFSQGIVLSKLLCEAKTETIIFDRVSSVTNDLLDRLKKERGSFPSEDSLVKILRKIEWTLGEFIRLDPNETRYRTLATSVGEFVSTIESPKTYRGPRDQYITDSANCENDHHLQEYNFANAYRSIDQHELYMLKLLGLLPAGEAIKKQDLLLWWNGIYGVPSKEEQYYESCLTKFVKKRLIEVVAVTSSDQTRLAGLVAPDGVRMKAIKLRLKYRLRDGMHNEIISQNNYNIVKRNSISAVRNLTPTINQSSAAMLNINERNLNAKTFDWISRMTDLELLHLGDWKDDPTRYIVVQDTDDMARVLKRVSFLYFLNLQGISGIVELPRAIYELRNLSTLILRGCHNLESLPDGIQSLSHLFHLDLSECYLLNHIPKQINALLNLTVLKGFIIPQDRDPSLSQALLSDLSKLQKLRKLTLRTRRLDFPTHSDLQTLCGLVSLTSLNITWVGASSSINQTRVDFDDSSKFPTKIEKLEIQAASESTATRLMRLISRQSDTNLKKFYVRGGGLRELVPINIDCKVLRLHYLPDLQLNCYQMMKKFPELHRLEMSSDVIYSLLRQSFKIASGCRESRDKDVSWNQSLKYPGTHDGPSM